MRLRGKALIGRARKVRLFLIDIDGVMTNGFIYHFEDPSGALIEFKGFHSQDSIAFAWLSQCGIPTGAISGRDAGGVRRRLEMLKASRIVLGRLDKAAALSEICREAGVAPEHVFYMGDDLPDIPALRRVGLAAAVRNARPEVRAAAHWVSRFPGGGGAVREAAEMILRAQGLWNGVLDRYEGRKIS